MLSAIRVNNNYEKGVKMEVKLLPCPFCGHNKPEILRSNNHFQIMCPNCFSMTLIENSESSVISTWNREELIDAGNNFYSVKYNAEEINQIIRDIEGTLKYNGMDLVDDGYSKALMDIYKSICELKFKLCLIDQEEYEEEIRDINGDNENSDF